MSERTYTLDEARAAMRREDCRRDGHAPSNRIVKFADPVGIYLCDCGEVTWRPTP